MCRGTEGEGLVSAPRPSVMIQWRERSCTFFTTLSGQRRAGGNHQVTAHASLKSRVCIARTPPQSLGNDAATAFPEPPTRPAKSSEAWAGEALLRACTAPPPRATPRAAPPRTRERTRRCMRRTGSPHPSSRGCTGHPPPPSHLCESMHATENDHGWGCDGTKKRVFSLHKLTDTWRVRCGVRCPVAPCVMAQLCAWPFRG